MPIGWSPIAQPLLYPWLRAWLFKTALIFNKQIREIDGTPATARGIGFALGGLSFLLSHRQKRDGQGDHPADNDESGDRSGGDLGFFLECGGSIH